LSGTHRLRINANSNVGYEHETGELVVLENCRGQHPTLSEAELSFVQGLDCERSIIVNDAEGMSQCHVTLTDQRDTIVTTINLNEYVVMTNDSKLTVGCGG
jgi:hypothetical protein